MFTDTMIRWLGNARDQTQRSILTALATPIFDRYSSLALSSAGLAIKAGSSAIVKTGASAAYFLANGVLQKISAATDMAALSGTVTNAKFNVYCFFIDTAGTVTSQMGTEGATLAAVKFPQFPLKKALIGFVIINPTGTGNFVGGTTALDDATVVPNAVYVNPLGAFDPACVTGL